MIPPDRLIWFFWSRRACFGLSINCRQHTRVRNNGMALENDFWTHSNVKVVELTISYTLRWGFRKSMNLLLDGLVHNVFLLGSALSISGSWIPLSTKSGSFELSINVLAGRVCQMIVKTGEFVDYPLLCHASAASREGHEYLCPVCLLYPPACNTMVEAIDVIDTKLNAKRLIQLFNARTLVIWPF